MWCETSVPGEEGINSDCGRYRVESWRLAVPCSTSRRSWADLLLCRSPYLRPVGAHCLTLCRQVSIKHFKIVVCISKIFKGYHLTRCCYFYNQQVYQAESSRRSKSSFSKWHEQKNCFSCASVIIMPIYYKMHCRNLKVRFTTMILNIV